MPDHSWNDTWILCNLLTNLSFHSMSFSWGCLTISEYSSIESLNYAVYNWGCSIVVNILLFRCCVKYFIKWELQTVFQILNFRGFNSDCFLIEQFMNIRGSQSFLSLINWPEPADNFNISSSCYFLGTWHWNSISKINLFKSN